ncbi:MAG: aldehyde ferredoxin oxidoreductase C-terminal domain-containing protein, partial [Desulfovermiculus sp.]
MQEPFDGGIKESNAGGQAAQILAKLGYAAIILEGERSGDDLYVVRISQDGVKIQKDDSLRMLTNYQLAEKFKDEFIKNGAMISIGTAGEMRMANSTVAVTDPEGRPTRHAGRGGVGAVMGSKGIKSILLDGAGTKVLQPKDPEKFKEANKVFTEGLQKNPTTGQGLPAYGTNVLTNVINEAGAYPTYNFKLGRYVDAENISGETQAELETQRGGNPTHGCHRGCVMRCSGVFVDKDGNYVSKQPEYETVWAHGGNCGICDLDHIAQLDFLDDDYGLDTIEMGATIAVAMEAGLLDFGDAKGAINLVHEVGKGTPLGRVLGSGTGATAKAYGLERAPVVKNQALPAYDPRSIKGIGVTYATSTMGAD